jgi:hypothetical protein
MGKRGRHRRGGRVTPKEARPTPSTRFAGQKPSRRDREPNLLTDVRHALADDHPLGLLALVSTLLAVVDPRRRSPLELVDEADQGDLSADELVRSFIDVDEPETTALLAVIVEMSPDELLRARVGRALATRSHGSPSWLDRLATTKADRTMEMVHVLGDGDNVMVGVRLPDGFELSVVVYIDHNLGTVVKDAFIVPEPLDDLVRFMRAKSDDPDTRWDDVDSADAKVRITEAIDVGVMTFPPFESDTWPACRPLVEWITRLLPDGGHGYDRPEWDDAALDAIERRFFDSDFAAGLDTEDHRGLLESLLWFGSDYGPGDPLRWSPVAVEILLDDWIPRKIVAPAEYLTKAPALLRAFVRFCHHERGIRPSLTAETLAAIDEWEPEYQATIRSSRPRGPATLIAAMGLIDLDGPWSTSDDDETTYAEIMLDALRRAVGSDAALDELVDVALPDEPFGWDEIPTDIHERVGEVLALTDRCCNETLDHEYRTACRRFLAAAAAGDPSVFRRKGRPDTAAAAICWVIGKANDLFSPREGGMLVKDLMGHFGLNQGSVSQRAATLLHAGGFPTHYGSTDLGSPRYLVSSRRRRILDLRDRYRAIDDA